MIERILQLNKELDDNIFLFGARQTGKSTILRQQFPQAIFIDLLNSEVRSRLSKRPSLLYDTYHDKPEGTLIIIDEIPEIPELLNEVHRLMSECNLRFILCGSSARKLKRRGYNTLGGRAYPCYFYPFVSAEIPDFDLQKALSVGMIPPHYLAKAPARKLAAYIDVYLREEIKEESLVRNLQGFQRFLEVAALTDGEMVNYTNIASDCGVSASAVTSYFSILEDTLLGFMVPAYTKAMSRRLVQTPRFYYFDVGVANYLLHRKALVRGTAEYGHAFEHFIIQELRAWLGYHHSEEPLMFWRTHTGLEVDAVIGDARVAIEIKSVEEVQSKHLKGLKAFGEDYPDSRRIIVSLDIFTRRIGEIEAIYVMDFLQQLWADKVI